MILPIAPPVPLGDGTECDDLVRLQVKRRHRKRGCYERAGAKPQKSVKIIERISHENHGHYNMMGADAPIPPVMIPAAAPEGAPRRPQLPVFQKNKIAQPCRKEAMRRGALAKVILVIFHGSGVNPIHGCFSRAVCFKKI
jgi:hypothetical protein